MAENQTMPTCDKSFVIRLFHDEFASAGDIDSGSEIA